MPSLDRGTKVTIDILGTDELALEAECRYVGEVAQADADADADADAADDAAGDSASDAAGDAADDAPQAPTPAA
jgi:exoribonuclease II